MGISGTHAAATGPRRAVLLGAVGAVLVLAGALAWTVLATTPDPRQRSAPAAQQPGPSASVGPRAADVSVADAVGSLAVLRDWDAARAAAWADGDAAALRALYLPGSAAGRADVTMLRSWTARGLRVRGMAMQVLAVELRERTTRRIELVVTDRLRGAAAVRAPARQAGEVGVAEPGRALPQDGRSTRRLVFRRHDGQWRMASVREVRAGRAAAGEG